MKGAIPLGSEEGRGWPGCASLASRQARQVVRRPEKMPGKAATKSKQKVESRKQKWRQETAQATQSHTGAKAEGRIKNAERHTKPPQSQLRATCMRLECGVHAGCVRDVLVFSSCLARIHFVFFAPFSVGSSVVPPRRHLRWTAVAWLLFKSNCAKTWRCPVCAQERFRAGPGP